MIELRYTKKGTPFVLASEIFYALGLNGVVAEWFIGIIKKGDNYINSTHYWAFYRTEKNSDGQLIQVQDFSVRFDMAKEIIVKEENEKSRSLLKYLLFLESQKEEGELLTKAQTSALMDIAEVLGLFSIQEFLEHEHYMQFLLNSKKYEWWEHRAKLFGVTVDDIKSIITNQASRTGVTYQNQRQALFHIDRYELIRRASIDLFKAMGKSDQFAKNVASTVKMLAERLNVRVYNDLGFTIDFNSEKDRNTIKQIKEYKKPQGAISLF